MRHIILFCALAVIAGRSVEGATVTADVFLVSSLKLLPTGVTISSVPGGTDTFFSPVGGAWASGPNVSLNNQYLKGSVNTPLDGGMDVASLFDASAGAGSSISGYLQSIGGLGLRFTNTTLTPVRLSFQYVVQYSLSAFGPDTATVMVLARMEARQQGAADWIAIADAGTQTSVTTGEADDNCEQAGCTGSFDLEIGVNSYVELRPYVYTGASASQAGEIPEPGSWWTAGAGVMAIGAMSRRR